MLRAYKSELDLTDNQKTFFNKSFGCSRVVYNYCLNLSNELYQKEGKSISAFDLCKEVVKLKKTEEKIWLNEIDHQTLCCSVMNLKKAYTNFFKQGKGFPNYKSKYTRQSCQFTQGNDVDFDNLQVRFPKIGWVKVKNIQTFKGDIKTVTVSKNTIGRYFVSILVDNHKELPKPKRIKEATSIGIDVGITTFATLSDGTKFDNPKFYENNQKRLACLQRRLSRKVKGSGRYKDAKYSVAKCHYDIANKRKDFIHKFTSHIVGNNQTVICESLNIDGMVKNHHLAKSIMSVSWGEAIRQLEYKCSWQGKNFIAIGQYEPSSKTCNCCGQVNKELTLKDRMWTCLHCNTTHDRDVNAAINIKKIGLRETGRGTAAGGVELSAIAGAKKRQVKSLNLV